MSTHGILAKQWDEIAGGYDELVTPINARSGAQALRHVELAVGTRFLDVAAGTGALSLPAARSGAEVLATDVSPTMIARLRDRAREEGLSNLDAQVMDGRSLELDDDLFDVVASQHGVSLFPEMAQGLGEMVRVARPGGQVLVSAFGPLEDAGVVNTFIQAVDAVAPDAPVPTPEDPPPPFQVADPAEFKRRMETAGLDDVHVKTLVTEATFSSPGHFWETLVHSNPIGANLDAGLSQAQRTRALEVVEDLLADGREGGVLSTEINVGVGVKPEEGA